MYKKYFSLLLVAFASANPGLLEAAAKYSANKFEFFANEQSARNVLKMSIPFTRIQDGKQHSDEKYFAYYSGCYAVIFAQAVIEKKDAAWFNNQISGFMNNDKIYEDKFKDKMDRYAAHLVKDYWGGLTSDNLSARRIGLTLLLDAMTQSVKMYNNAVIPSGTPQDQVFALQFAEADPEVAHWYAMYNKGINDPAWTSISRLPKANDAGWCGCWGSSVKESKTDKKKSSPVAASSKKEETANPSTEPVIGTAADPMLKKDELKKGECETIQVRTEKVESGCCLGAGASKSTSTTETKTICNNSQSNSGENAAAGDKK